MRPGKYNSEMPISINESSNTCLKVFSGLSLFLRPCIQPQFLASKVGSGHRLGNSALFT